MDTLAFTSCIFEEDEEAEEDEVSVPLLGQSSSSTAITQEEEVIYMDNNTGANDDSRPSKVYDEDELDVEIPQTAHQISKGNIVLTFWSFCFWHFIGLWKMGLLLLFLCCTRPQNVCLVGYSNCFLRQMEWFYLVV